ASEREVTDQPPDDEEQDHEQDRDSDLAPPADLARRPCGRLRPRPAGTAPAVASGAGLLRRALRRGHRRHSALDAAATVEAIRLLSAGRRHPAAYGSQRV